MFPSCGKIQRVPVSEGNMRLYNISVSGGKIKLLHTETLQDRLKLPRLSLTGEMSSIMRLLKSIRKSYAAQCRSAGPEENTCQRRVTQAVFL